MDILNISSFILMSVGLLDVQQDCKSTDTLIVTPPVRCGYKIVDRKLCGIGRFQYEIGKSYNHEGKLEVGLSGFHYCEKALDCINFCENYGYDGYRYLCVESLGDMKKNRDTIVTNNITIVNELTIDEIKFLMCGVRLDHMGNKFWYMHGVLHREDGPAIEYKGGKIMEWALYGKRHRTDGPAIDSPEEKKWYINGLLHRDNGPAVVHINGTQLWYQNGKLHREDGPAAIYPMGYIEFYEDGILIRSEKKYTGLKV